MGQPYTSRLQKLLYGKRRWFGPWPREEHFIQNIIFNQQYVTKNIMHLWVVITR
jgi:hypothetical protein